MNKKEQAQERINNYNKEVVLITDYINMRKDITLECKICGTKWTTKMRNIVEKNRCVCPNCEMTGKKELLQKIINKEHPNIITIGEYKNTNENILLKCTDCGHQWSATPNNLKRGTGCPSCANVLKKTKEEIIEHLKEISPNITVKGEYINSTTPIECICNICQNQWYPIWGNLKKGHGCPSCARNKKLTIQIAKQRLKSINENIIILNEEYINSSSKLKCRCLECNKEWEVKWSHLNAGHGCPVCNKGLVNEKRREENKEKWSKISAKLYIVKVYDENEEFIKVGITRHELKLRFKDLPYNFEVVKIIEGNLYEVSCIEHDFFKKFNQYSYEPKKYFAGHTECFSLNMLEFI